MKTALAGVVGLLVGAGFMLVARGGIPGAAGGGAPGGHGHGPKDRASFIILAKWNGTDCTATKSDPLRVLKNDRVRIAVYNFCGIPYDRIKIDWKSSNDPNYPQPPVTGNANVDVPFRTTGAFERADLSFDLGFPGNATPPTDPNTGQPADAWYFDYAITLMQGGAWQQPLADPQLEVDPWSS